MPSAIYPGTFDPITNGHLFVIRRAIKIFDPLTIAVTDNIYKHPLFTIEERMDLIKQVTADLPNVRVQSFSGLLVDFAVKVKANVMIRGLREPNDFLSEYQMALMNRLQREEIETVFMVSSADFNFVSSSLIKEIAQLGGDIHLVVPACVVEALKIKFRSV